MMGYRQCPGCGVYVLYEKGRCFYCDFDLSRSPRKSISGWVLTTLKALYLESLVCQFSGGINEGKRRFPVTGRSD